MVVLDGLPGVRVRVCVLTRCLAKSSVETGNDSFDVPCHATHMGLERVPAIASIYKGNASACAGISANVTVIETGCCRAYTWGKDWIVSSDMFVYVCTWGT